jgi:hypothetical protein
MCNGMLFVVTTTKMIKALHAQLHPVLILPSNILLEPPEKRRGHGFRDSGAGIRAMRPKCCEFSCWSCINTISIHRKSGSAHARHLAYLSVSLLNKLPSMFHTQVSQLFCYLFITNSADSEQSRDSFEKVVLKGLQVETLKVGTAR